MKKNLIALRRATFFVLALSASSALVADGDASNKTFLSPRSPSVNMAHKYTTWADHVYPRRCDKIHTSFQLTGFFSESEKGKDLGRYFGIGNGSNSFTVGDAGAGAEIEADFLMHNSAGDPNASGTITLSPRQEVWGARLDFFQDINFNFAKLFIAATLPVVSVQQNMRIHTTDGQPTRAIGGTEFTLEDFFSGEFANSTEVENLQESLTHAKIVGSHSKTGVADIELELGWKALERKKYHLFVNLGLTIPTSNKAHGRFLFEPIYGNGGHFALGAGIDAGMTLWCKDKNKVRLLVAGDYRFLFKNTQQRTLGLLIAGEPSALAHYAPGFVLDQAAGTPLFPLANVLTRDVRVEPGSQIEALAALSFNFCRLTFDAGYNLYWRERESVKVRSWEDGVIYLAALGRETTTDAYDAASIAARGDDLINRENLNVAAAATPSLLSHKIFGGLAYSGKIKDHYPCSFGIGGSYEFADSNADLENWSIWLKAIFSF